MNYPVQMLGNVENLLSNPSKSTHFIEFLSNSQFLPVSQTNKMDTLKYSLSTRKLLRKVETSRNLRTRVTCKINSNNETSRTKTQLLLSKSLNFAKVDQRFVSSKTQKLFRKPFNILINSQSRRETIPDFRFLQRALQSSSFLRFVSEKLLFFHQQA